MRAFKRDSREHAVMSSIFDDDLVRFHHMRRPCMSTDDCDGLRRGEYIVSLVPSDISVGAVRNGLLFVTLEHMWIVPEFGMERVNLCPAEGWSSSDTATRNCVSVFQVWWHHAVPTTIMVQDALVIDNDVVSRYGILARYARIVHWMRRPVHRPAPSNDMYTWFEHHIEQLHSRTTCAPHGGTHHLHLVPLFSAKYMQKLWFFRYRFPSRYRTLSDDAFHFRCLRYLMQHPGYASDVSNRAAVVSMHPILHWNALLYLYIRVHPTGDRGRWYARVPGGSRESEFEVIGNHVQETTSFVACCLCSRGGLWRVVGTAPYEMSSEEIAHQMHVVNLAISHDAPSTGDTAHSGVEGDWIPCTPWSMLASDQPLVLT